MKYSFHAGIIFKKTKYLLLQKLLQKTVISPNNKSSLENLLKNTWGLNNFSLERVYLVNILF